VKVGHQSLIETYRNARERLLAQRSHSGHWRGELSSSALATATAVCALCILDRDAYGETIDAGLRWLVHDVNSDGGWGDTPISQSNLSTTVLVLSALGLIGTEKRFGETIKAGESWIVRRCGSIEATRIAQAIKEQYGTDRTFSAPILGMCAIAGRLGSERSSWELVPQLPFELAAVPHRFWRSLGLSVVSYAIPALIALGQVRHRCCPSGNPIIRLVRNALQTRTLRILRDIQPESGGYLEAVPLTSFVAMSLAKSDLGADRVVGKAIGFVASSARSDGSWAIDSDLSTWVSSLSIAVLCEDSEAVQYLDGGARRTLRQWFLAQQHREEHPYTHARGGGWGWSDLPGSVPDADDTAAALIALRELSGGESAAPPAVERGISWLLAVQNRDGGIPTFSRGWGKLPFDRSSPDITSHSLRAWGAWLPKLNSPLAARVRRSASRALRYLHRAQRQDGSWVPLWFGNENTREQENPTFGTSRVLLGLAEFDAEKQSHLSEAALRGLAWLLGAQGTDGGWGGDGSSPPSIEETAVALEALARLYPSLRSSGEQAIVGRLTEALSRGCEWLIERTEGGRTFDAAPIGLYFARLWYYERAYPLIFTIAALGRVLRSGL